jgi:hypothetical protein
MDPTRGSTKRVMAHSDASPFNRREDDGFVTLVNDFVSISTFTSLSLLSLLVSMSSHRVLLHNEATRVNANMVGWNLSKAPVAFD